MTDTLDIAHLKQWIGRTDEQSDVITAQLVKGLRATLFLDIGTPQTGDAAPFTTHWCLAQPVAAMDKLGSDGHPARGGFLPPVPLPRRMWAGGEVQFIAPLQVGDAVTRSSKILDVNVKTGSTGTLCFVNVEHLITTKRGLAIRERQDIVYREAAGAQTGTGATAERDDAAAYEQVWAVPATPTLLFRYSAMTFNGHRFHYDQPYATRVEGYADLVVHGPIQATLLMNLAATLLGRVPRTFTHRGVSPLTANQIFRICGRRTGEGFEGVTLDEAGRVCMRARAAV